MDQRILIDGCRFLKDYSGNNLEFKAMTKQENLFARYDIENALIK